MISIKTHLSTPPHASFAGMGEWISQSFSFSNFAFVVVVVDKSDWRRFTSEYWPTYWSTVCRFVFAKFDADNNAALLKLFVQLELIKSLSNGTSAQPNVVGWSISIGGECRAPLPHSPLNGNSGIVATESSPPGGATSRQPPLDLSKKLLIVSYSLSLHIISYSALNGR